MAEFLYKRTITSKEVRFKYLFSFKDIRHPDLYGDSIKEFWNDIYDYFADDGRMIVKRVDGKDFMLAEAKKLLQELIENMGDDMSVVSGSFITLKKLQLVDEGEIYGYVVNDDGTQGYDFSKKRSEEEIEKEGKGLEAFRWDLSRDMSFLEEEFQELRLKKILKNFGISDTRGFRALHNEKLKYCLERFERFREDRKNNVHILYNIIEKIEKQSGKYYDILSQSNLAIKDIKNVKKILNDNPIIGSRHEGRKDDIRAIKRDELKFCEEVTKKLVKAWLHLEQII